ncbi:TetR/AcrR family transcriptional regulator [Nocardioides speluncae]|uniref:TetR/AcrR family transcriptional regulator n=1 Tax=Nocardioides speluncae TaxID=2670337 RepID=UPI000D689B23|nr:TetR/AcrR family transcriptional regulator [Nocardioides speluncae]
MPRVTEEHRTARRDQILSAAMRCVARDGFHKMTMANVIAESGLSAGAVYGYFKGKNDLIQAIARRAVGGFAADLDTLADGDDQVTLPGALEVVLARARGLTADSEGGLPRIAIHAWSEAARDDEVKEIVRTNIDSIIKSWARVLARARADGNLGPDGDLDQMARSMYSLMIGFALQGLILDDVDEESYLAGFTALLA